MGKTEKEKFQENKSMAQERIVDRLLTRENLIRDLLYVVDEDELFIWEEGYYQRLERGIELKTRISDALKAEKNPENFGPAALNPGFAKNEEELPLHIDFSITPFLIDSIITQIPTEIPKDRRTPTIANSFITFSDNIVVDFADPTFTKLPATRAIPSFFKVPFPSTILDGDFDPATACPRFHQFLKEVLVLGKHDHTPDQSLIDFIQEVMGYTLFSSIPNQSAVFFTGEGANGKSILLHVIRNMFPPGATSSVNISSIAKSNFQLAAIIGKKVNIVHEEESKEMRVDILKNIISGEPMTIERKYRSAIEIVPTAKFLWGSNEMPTFEKLDEAIKRRIHIVPFRRTFAESERDLMLLDKLKAEEGGILRFAIEGAKRLREKDMKLTAPDSIKTSFNEVAEERYPAIRFFKQHYEITGDPEDRITNKEVYKLYTIWCDENGHRNVLAEQNFGKQVLSIDDRIKGGDNIKAYYEGKRFPGKSGFRRRPDSPEPNAMPRGIPASDSQAEFIEGLMRPPTPLL